MARPKGRSITPADMLEKWQMYEQQRRHRQARSRSGFTAFIGKTRTTFKDLMDTYHFEYPPIPEGGYAFLLEEDPPHAILWRSSEELDVAGRRHADLRRQVDETHHGYLVDVAHRTMLTRLRVHRGENVDPFLYVVAEPIGWLDEPLFLQEQDGVLRIEPVPARDQMKTEDLVDQKGKVIRTIFYPREYQDLPPPARAVFNSDGRLEQLHLSFPEPRSLAGDRFMKWMTDLTFSQPYRFAGDDEDEEEGQSA